MANNETIDTLQRIADELDKLYHMYVESTKLGNIQFARGLQKAKVIVEYELRQAEGPYERR